VLIKIRPDTVYGLGVVPVRFSVDASIPQHLIPVVAVPTLKKAIEQFERLGDGYGHHYRFRDDIPIRFEYSRIQGDPSTLHSKTKDRLVIPYEQRIFNEGIIDCVAYLTFEQPLINVAELPPEDEKDQSGFLPHEELPEELKQALKEEDNGE
jgi:hypothetical protein